MPHGQFLQRRAAHDRETGILRQRLAEAAASSKAASEELEELRERIAREEEQKTVEGEGDDDNVALDGKMRLPSSPLWKTLKMTTVFLGMVLSETVDRRTISAHKRLHGERAWNNSRSGVRDYKRS